MSPGVLSSQLMHELKLNATSLGMLSGFYYWTYTAFQIPSGLLYDTYPKHWIIGLAFLICALGGTVFACATALSTAVAGRLLMGAGSAFAFVGVLVVGSSVFPKRYFNAIAGTTQFVGAMGAMLAQSPLQFASRHFGWRAAILSISLFGITSALLTLRALRRLSPPIPTGSSNLWKHLQHVCRQRRAWQIAVCACFCWGPMLGFSSLWGIPFLIHVQHTTPSQAAHLIELSWLAVAVFAVLLGLWADRIQQQRLPMLCAISAGIIALITIYSEKPLCHGLQALCMIGLGAACTSVTLTFPWIKSLYSKPYQATALGFNNTWLVVSGLIFQPLMGWIINLQHHASHYVQNYTNSDYKHGLATLIISFAIAWLTCLFCKSTTNDELHHYSCAN